MLSAIIIDDMPNNIEELQILLKKYCPEVNILETFQSGFDGIEGIKKLKPNLVFLDVEMPSKNGFDVLKAFKEINFEIIFTTWHAGYAIKAFRFNAIDYILKPIDSKILKEAVNKVKVKKIEGDQNKKMKNFLEFLDGGIPKLTIPTKNGIKFIPVTQVLYFDTKKGYTLNNQIFYNDKSLKTLDEVLSQFGFFRIHQNHLINLKHVSSYFERRLEGKEERFVKMTINVELEVSRRQKKYLLPKLRSMGIQFEE